MAPSDWTPAPSTDGAASSSAVDTLKSRYYKYLDTLCQANAIDIGSLKGSAAREYCQLELFFGGLPVLVGLKYFPSLRVLRLFGQEIISLRPLNDVASTLEELWICEGPLKDISGIENCIKLRQLHLYDNKIEDVSPLSKLYALEVLWIMNNRINDFSFISALPSLKVLYAGGKQFSETAALSVEEWPVKLQHLDLSANALTCLKELFPIMRCTVMRVLNLSDERLTSATRNQLIHHENQLAWLAFHFCYLERLNGDCVAEKFSEMYTNIANKELIDQRHRWLIAERAFRLHSERIRRNCEKVDERLRTLVTALLKAMTTVSKREGRREIVLQALRQAQSNQERLKLLKKNYVTMEYFIHRLANYYVPSWRLEGARPAEVWPLELGESELHALEQNLRFRCSKKEELSLKVRYALQLVANINAPTVPNANTASGKLSVYDQLLMVRFFENTVNRIVGSKTRVSVRIDNHFYTNCFRVGPATAAANNNLRLAVYFCDNCHRRGMPPPKKPSTDEDLFTEVSVVTDVSDILTAEDYKNGFIVLPLFQNRKNLLQKPSRDSSKITGSRIDKSKLSRNDSDDTDETLLNLRDLDVAVLCLVEINESKSIQFDELNDVLAFDDRITHQVKKFRELGIDVRLGGTSVPADSKLADKEKSAANDEAEAADGLVELLSTDKNILKKNKYRISDVDIASLGALRWRGDKPVENMAQRSFSLRNPLDLMFALYRVPIFKTKDLFQKIVTCLELSEMKLKKLNGVEALSNLMMLNVSRNRIVSLEPLNTLESLIYLDASSNKVTKVGEIPMTLTELNLAKNSINCLLFCSRLQSLRHLNVNGNRIKSLKGIETAKDLEVLMCAGNLLRDRNEIELLMHFANLHIIDLTDNPITEMESFRKRLLFHCPSLISINHEKVPNEEKNLMQRKSGKVLTLEYLERHFGGAEITQSLMLSNQDFRMIALDHQAILKLQAVTLLDLANNFLEHVYEVVELDNLKHLNLSNNAIVSLCAENQISANLGVPISQITILLNLTNLNLSQNKINNSALGKMGIGKLVNLEVLNLSGNDLTKLDSSLFEANAMLRELDLSRNDIRVLIKKKNLTSLRTLNLADNKLKDLEGLCFPNIETLDLSNNKINNCAGLKPVSQLPNLRELTCAGNAVTERRVYVDFILEQAPKLQHLDGISREAIRVMPSMVDKRSGSIAPFAMDPDAGSTLAMATFQLGGDDNGIMKMNSVEITPDHCASLTPKQTTEPILLTNGFKATRSSFASSRRPSNFAISYKPISVNNNANGNDYTYFPMGMNTAKSMPSVLNADSKRVDALNKRKSFADSNKLPLYRNASGLSSFGGLDIFGTSYKTCEIIEKKNHPLLLLFLVAWRIRCYDKTSAVVGKMANTFALVIFINFIMGERNDFMQTIPLCEVLTYMHLFIYIIMATTEANENLKISLHRHDVPTPLVIVIKQSTMGIKMERNAIATALTAMAHTNEEQQVAKRIKMHFDTEYGEQWHCIVGQCFGCLVAHIPECFIYFYINSTAITLFRTHQSVNCIESTKL